MEVSATQAFYTIPRSCCLHSLDEAACDAARRPPIAAPIDAQRLHVHGCTERLVAALQENVAALCAVALAVVGVELVGLVCALVLSCALPAAGEYK